MNNAWRKFFPKGNDSLLWVPGTKLIFRTAGSKCITIMLLKKEIHHDYGGGGEVVRNDNILKEVKQITTVESSVELAQKKN